WVADVELGPAGLRTTVGAVPCPGLQRAPPFHRPRDCPAGIAFRITGKEHFRSATGARGAAAVIQHIVLLKWKPGTTDAQIDAAFDQAQALVKGIDSVERVTLGRNRARDDHGFTHALIVKLSDDQALSDYPDHPVRKRYLVEV